MPVFVLHKLTVRYYVRECFCGVFSNCRMVQSIVSVVKHVSIHLLLLCIRVEFLASVGYCELFAKRAQRLLFNLLEIGGMGSGIGRLVSRSNASVDR